MQKEIILKTNQREELIDITEQVKSIIASSGVKEGVCHIFVRHATAGIIINENADPNISLDFLEALRNLIPSGKWRHDRVDQNADAHLKAALIGSSQAIPIKDGKLLLGTWQSIFFCEFDGPRESRKVIVNI
jgi:secondary thiamine-phosphate synthase enzyme